MLTVPGDTCGATSRAHTHRSAGRPTTAASAVQPTAVTIAGRRTWRRPRSTRYTTSSTGLIFSTVATPKPTPARRQRSRVAAQMPTAIPSITNSLP